MFKKISVFFVAVMLAGCSSISDITSYIPFMGKDKKVIDLDKDKIDQKSYAAAYEATVATYKDRVTKNFFVDNFASGANDWYLVVLLCQSNKFKINSTQVVMILMCMLTTVVCCMQKHYKPTSAA